MSYTASETSAPLAVKKATRCTIIGLPSSVIDPDDFPVSYQGKLEYKSGATWYPLSGKNLHQYDDVTELTDSPKVTDADGLVTFTISSGELAAGDHTIRVKYLGD